MTTEKLTNIGLQNFLKDFKDNSKTEVFESGKQKDEIIKIAKAKMGIDLQNNTDLAGFKTIYTFADVANGNGARLPKYLLLKALPTIIGKPVNINHVRNYVVGYYIDYRYIEAKDQVIAYGIFFKSNFGAEWTEAKSLLKANLLGTSHEVWCPKRSRRYLSDGTYEATAMEFAGGALIYRTHQDALNPTRKMKTAYKDCDVLEMAMQHMDQNPSDLIFASLDDKKQKTYESDDLIVASEAEEFARRTEAEIQQKVDSGFHRSHEIAEQPTAQEETPSERPQLQPQAVPKVVCGNCKHEFETMEVGELSCSECKAIIDRTGKVLFPPQIINFKFRDPEDGFVSWRLLESNKELAIVKNLESGKIYQLNFKKSDDNDKIIDKMNFVYVGTASCPQCGYSQSISTTSNVERFHLECKSCGLKYHKNIKKDSLGRQIAEYLDITEEYKNRLLEKEPDPMADKTKELHVASLQENQIKELEVASLTGTEETICNLEIASLQDIDETLKLEIASQDSVEDVFSESILTLDVASMEEDENSFESLDDSLMVAKILTTQGRKSLSDDVFAVVKTVKNKRTGEPRKIRKFPIHDEAHVRNALARLAQEPTQKALQALGISVESVTKKVLARAKTLNMKDLLERHMEKASVDQMEKYKVVIRKMVNKVRSLRREINLETANLKSANMLEVAKIQEDADKKIEFYKINAFELIKRRDILGEFGNDLSDNNIMDDEIFSKTCLEKENVLLKASMNNISDIVGDKQQLKEDYDISRLAKEINYKAFS